MPRPTAKAVRNFLVGYCMAPAAKSNGHDGKRRRQKSGDRNRGEAPAFKDRIYPVGRTPGKPLLQSLFTAFASHAIGKIAAENGSRQLP